MSKNTLENDVSKQLKKRKLLVRTIWIVSVALVCFLGAAFFRYIGLLKDDSKFVSLTVSTFFIVTGISISEKFKTAELFYGEIVDWLIDLRRIQR